MEKTRLLDENRRREIKAKILWNQIVGEYNRTNDRIKEINEEIETDCTWEHHCKVLSPEMDRLLSTREMVLWNAICELRKEKADLDITEIYCRLNGRGFKILSATGIKNLIEEMETDKQYSAIRPMGSRLISVLARNRTEAKMKIEEQLNRPGRRDVLKSWKLDGSLIELTD